jgi:hypothetical protein
VDRQLRCPAEEASHSRKFQQDRYSEVEVYEPRNLSLNLCMFPLLNMSAMKWDILWATDQGVKHGVLRKLFSQPIFKQ